MATEVSPTPIPGASRAAPAEAGGTRAMDVINPCHIMLVDDDPDFAEVLKSILEDEGYQVVTAADGQVALDLLREGLSPEVILLDLRMPVMNGFEFEAHRREEALAQHAALLIISSEPSNVSALLDADAVMRKPFDGRALAAMARNYIGKN